MKIDLGDNRENGELIAPLLIFSGAVGSAMMGLGIGYAAAKHHGLPKELYFSSAVYSAYAIGLGTLGGMATMKNSSGGMAIFSTGICVSLEAIAFGAGYGIGVLTR